MADNTKIEWTDATWNPIRARNLRSSSPQGGSASSKTGGLGHFCVHVSEGCRNCYAERMQPRFKNPIRFAAQDRDKVNIILDETVLTQPLRWKRGRKIFPCSMTDLFGDWVTDAMIDRIFAVMALTPRHTYQIVTKRPERMQAWMTEKWQPAKAHTIEMGRRNAIAVLAETQGEDRHDQVLRECEHFLDEFKLSDTENDALWTEDGSLKCMQFKWPLPNVWLGVSVEDQKTADERIPILLDTPSAIRFISAEPLLTDIDILKFLIEETDNTYRLLSIWYGPDGFDETGSQPEAKFKPIKPCPLNWVIAGGESGPKARPTHPDWFRSLRDQCQAAGVAFLFKQWGEWLGQPDPLVAYSGDRLGWVRGRDGLVATTHQVERIEATEGHQEDWKIIARIGKAEAGRQLDGRTWDEFPS